MSKKVISTHQPNFFPWLGYFYKIAKSDVFVILDNVELQINNNNITSRTRIKCANEEKYFNVSVKKNKESRLIKDLHIDKEATKLKKHLKTIQLNYCKAEFYKETYPLIEKMLSEYENYELLSDANTFIIKNVCVWLGINTPFIKASDLGISTNDRNQRIVEICGKLYATHYFSGLGAKKYNNENLFNANRISIIYTDFVAEPYTQIGTKFIEGLSTLDALLNCGIVGTKKILKLSD